MATFVALLDYTEKGVGHIKESIERADHFVEEAKQAGVTVKDLYWTTGGHDGVLVLEAPDEQTAFSLVLSLAAKGNVRTSTLRAFDRAGMQAILDGAR